MLEFRSNSAAVVVSRSRELTPEPLFVPNSKARRHSARDLYSPPCGGGYTPSYGSTPPTSGLSPGPRHGNTPIVQHPHFQIAV
jgi:hypothetical protein